ncbi:diaminopimelate epimerase [Nemorincola caseinilytica]|uniref:Diaminopimelate epimerase n=1 Tax=Nemorincola caseinilytica TaxID=2054315 RepID=A0ABP8N1Q3_9BACT
MTFSKYHGTGNDFILVDNRNGSYSFMQPQVAAMCHRRFGIGADGLMLLENADGYDFRMVYYNADGNESTMCGNGGRCIVAYAQKLGIITDKAHFLAIDGPHHATIHTNGVVSLQMQDVKEMLVQEGHTVLNTGSPHYVTWVKDVKNIEVFTEGRTIRNRQEYSPGGINVNFVQTNGDKLRVRTYERGVEDETMSCGTGVTAAAIASTCHGTGAFSTHIETPGGDLMVSFTKDTPTSAHDVVLTGMATFVFDGEIPEPTL